MRASNPLWFGLYGAYLRDRELDLGPFKLFQNPNADAAWSSDKSRHWLTVVGYLPSGLSTTPHHLVTDLAAAWTVVQQQDVLWGRPLEAFPATTPIEDIVADFVESQDLHRERRKRGFDSPIAAALFFDAIESLFTNLQNSSEEFRGSCYRCAESKRLTTKFLDMTYYLLFSGLELLARAKTGNYGNDVSTPIFTYLADPQFGAAFDVVKEPENPLYRSVRSYCHVRNALFHNGQLKVTKGADGGRRSATYDLNHYELMLEGLLPLVLVRESGLVLDQSQRDTWTLPALRNGPPGGWQNVLG